MSIEAIRTQNALPIDSSGSPAATSISSSPTHTTLLPDPSTCLMNGDIGAEITALAVKAGQSERSLDTQAEQAENALQDKAEQAEVSTLKDEASAMRATAWESGCMQMAAGVATIASAGLKADSLGAVVAKGAAEGLSGGATLASGLGKAAETDSDAMVAAYKATAASAQRSGDLQRQAQKDASDFVQAAIDFYREYQSTKAQAQAAALHGA